MVVLKSSTYGIDNAVTFDAIAQWAPVALPPHTRGEALAAISCVRFREIN
jgi:hypothetical protein